MKLPGYVPRTVEFAECVSRPSTRIKIYKLSFRETFSAHSAYRKAVDLLNEWVDPESNAGFMIVHEARDGVWVLVNQWIEGHMLRTKTYFSDLDGNDLRQLPADGSMACVWELPIIDFERRAWIESMLLPKNGGDPEMYFRTRLNGEV